MSRVPYGAGHLPVAWWRARSKITKSGLSVTTVDNAHSLELQSIAQVHVGVAIVTEADVSALSNLHLEARTPALSG